MNSPGLTLRVPSALHLVPQPKNEGDVSTLASEVESTALKDTKPIPSQRSSMGAYKKRIVVMRPEEASGL